MEELLLLLLLLLLLAVRVGVGVVVVVVVVWRRNIGEKWMKDLKLAIFL